MLVVAIEKERTFEKVAIVSFLTILFILSALLMLVSCLALLLTKNIMHACTFLLAALLGVAGLYLTLHADTLAVTQVLVYVGGVVILMLFAVVLTGGQDQESITKEKFPHLAPLFGSKSTFLKAFLVSMIFFVAAASLLRLGEKEIVHVVAVNYAPTIQSLGQLLMTDYLFAFELVSVLLLGALIGAALIARPMKK